jgi:diguanylate cyclase (GGDEF)-like protein
MAADGSPREGGWVTSDDEGSSSAEAFPDGDDAVRAVEELSAATRDPATLETLTRVRATLRVLQQRAEAAEAKSLRDPLTHLANRRAWREALHTETERCRRDGRGAVLVVIDLDDFKAYNDTFGHLAGDLLLRHVGETLMSASRTNDVVARIGGDEFAVIAVGAESSVPVGQRIREALARAGVAASIGMARIEPQGDLAEAWGTADRTMYDEKVRRHGGSRG